MAEADIGDTGFSPSCAADFFGCEEA